MAGVKPQHSRGVTLIEMLVVLFIIGVMTGVVMLSAGIVDPAAEEANLGNQVDRLLTLTDFAEDQAVLTGEPIGLILLSPDEEPGWRYYWQRYRGGEWVDTAEPLTGTELPPQVEVTLKIEGQLAEFSRREPDDPPPLPSVVFYPGGEITPFVMTLFDAEVVDEQTVITSERLGKVEVLSEELALDYL